MIWTVSEKLFEQYGDKDRSIDCGASGSQYGVVPPEDGFLQGLRDITKQYRAVLIFDEVYRFFDWLLAVPSPITVLHRI